MNAVTTSRRRFLSYFSGVGLTSTLLPGTLWARMQEQEALVPQTVPVHQLHLKITMISPMMAVTSMWLGIVVTRFEKYPQGLLKQQMSPCTTLTMIQMLR